MPQVLQSVVARLNERADLQDGVGRLMGSVEIVDELIAINSESHDLARLIFQASVAALANSQSVEAIETELKRPATPTNRRIAGRKWRHQATAKRITKDSESEAQAALDQMIEPNISKFKMRCKPFRKDLRFNERVNVFTRCYRGSLYVVKVLQSPI